MRGKARCAARLDARQRSMRGKVQCPGRRRRSGGDSRREAKSIADGSSSLDYVRQTASENGIDEKVRFHHRVTSAQWSSDDACWTVEAQRSDTGETVRISCSFLLMCSGYYRYDQGYTPEFPGIERFGGTVVHPQKWSEDVDYAG